MTKQVKDLKFKMKFYLNRKWEKNKIKWKKKRNWTSFYHRNSRPLARLPPPATHVRNWRTRRLGVLKPPVKVLVNCTPACEWRRSNSLHRIAMITQLIYKCQEFRKYSLTSHQRQRTNSVDGFIRQSLRIVTRRQRHRKATTIPIGKTDVQLQLLFEKQLWI